ncbi:hypothetical protein Tco_0654717 [Tanacetum coccineum]|uniref:Uncharacterized protein n=1 Tax=Tanacetum coccineum TaxID=301880 RepID=A0ABQ4X4I1_9ASTR
MNHEHHINQQLGDMSHHKKIYVNPSHTKKIFANTRREGKDFSGRVTPLFETMIVQPTPYECVDSGIPNDSNQTPITTQPSSFRSQKKQSRRKQRKDTAVLDLEKAKDGQAKEIADLKKRVQKLERKNKSRTIGLKRLRKVGMSRRVESSKDKDIVKTNQSAKEREVDTSVEDSAAPTTIKEITLAQTLIQIKQLNLKLLPTVATTTTTTRPKARRVVVQEPMEAKLIEKKALQGKRKKKPTRFDDHGNNNTSNHGAEFDKKETKESSKGIEDELKSDKSKKAESSEEKAKGNRKKMLGKKRAGKEQQQESSKKQRMKDDKEQGEAWKKVDEVG